MDTAAIGTAIGNLVPQLVALVSDIIPVAIGLMIVGFAVRVVPRILKGFMR